MTKLLTLLSTIPVTVYFFVVIILLLMAVLAVVDHPSEFWCTAAVLLNVVFLVLLYLASISNEVLVRALVLIPLWLCILHTLAWCYPPLAPKVATLFEIFVFIVMVAVFCTMFEHIYVVLCQHGRPLLQGLLWLLGRVGIVDLQYNQTTTLVYHIIAGLTAGIVLFSFSVATYLSTPFVLSSIQRIGSECSKFWEEKS
jgi:hypothetical protein